MFKRYLFIIAFFSTITNFAQMLEIEDLVEIFKFGKLESTKSEIALHKYLKKKGYILVWRQLNLKGEYVVFQPDSNDNSYSFGVQIPLKDPDCEIEYKFPGDVWYYFYRKLIENPPMNFVDVSNRKFGSSDPCLRYRNKFYFFQLCLTKVDNKDQGAIYFKRR